MFCHLTFITGVFCHRRVLSPACSVTGVFRHRRILSPAYSVTGISRHRRISSPAYLVIGVSRHRRISSPGSSQAYLVAGVSRHRRIVHRRFLLSAFSVVVVCYRRIPRIVIVYLFVDFPILSSSQNPNVESFVSSSPPNFDFLLKRPIVCCRLRRCRF